MVHLNSSALINPLPSMSNTLNISRISASVSVFFHPGVHQVEKFSKVNDAISSKRKI